MEKIVSGDRFNAVAHKITTSPPTFSEWHKLRCLSSKNFDPLLVNLKKKQNKENSSQNRYRNNSTKIRKTETPKRLGKNYLSLEKVLKSIEVCGQEDYLSPNDVIYQQVQEMVDDVAASTEESRGVSHNNPDILQNNEVRMQQDMDDTKEDLNVSEQSRPE